MCDGFRCMAKGLNHTDTCTSLPQTPLPSRLPRDTEQGSLALEYPAVLVGDLF